MTAPVYVPPETPVGAEVGTSMVDAADLTGYKTTGNYPGETQSVREAQWFVSNLSSGTGTSVNSVTSENGEDVLCINTTKVGANDYEVQLIHHVPLERGYRYEVSFDAKADSAKAVAAKFTDIDGYPAYSDTFSVDLESDWKHYSYSFDMAADTDANGRLEFTVGGATGKTYFKNFSIVCVGKTPVDGEDDAKTPLSNGNHVYNGTFDQGNKRIYFWHAAENTTLTSSKADRVAVVTGTAADSAIYQKGMNLLSSDKYQVNLTLSAANAGNVTVRLHDAANTTVYGEETFAVTGTAAANSFTFTMPAGVTDTEAVLEIVTGQNTVYVDNVSMKRLTNNNLDWSKVDLYPLYNGDFFNGDDGWNIWSENAGWQQHSVNADGNMDLEYSVGEGADFWCVGVQSSAIGMAEGVPYKIVINYESTTNASIKVETPDGTQKDYDFASGAHTMEISFTPLQDLSGKISMYFGNQASNGNQHFIISSVEVVVDEETAEIPEAYRVAKPGSIASAGAVKAGKNIVIKTNNATWAEAITTVYVNGKAYDAAEYVTANGSEITIASSLMSEEGSYTIKFDADGYAQTKAVTQNVLEASGNVIVNGKFTDNMDGWETFFSSWNVANGSAESVDGEAVIHVVSSEGNNWDCQLKQAGLKLDAADYYMLSFDAYATIERPIQMEFGNLGTASQTIVNLGTKKQTYYIYFTDVAATEAASILFMTGNVNGCLSDFAAVGSHDIMIDNVCLCQAELSDIYAVIAPVVALKNQVVLGNDIVLSYEENTVWEKKEISVAVDGKTVADKYVSVDTSANEIVIDGAVLGNAGSHTVTVTAEGYSAVSVSVNALEDSNASIFAEGWTTWVGDGDQGTLTVLSEDSFTFDFVETVYHEEWQLGMFWTAQAKKENITTVADTTYVLSFDTKMIYNDSSITDAREIVLETNLGQVKLSVPAGEEHFEMEYTPGAKSDFYVLFMVGGTEKGIAPHNITISNVSLAEKTEGETVVKLQVAAPDAVKAETKEDGSVVISWEAVDGADTYGIYLADEEDGSYALVGDTNETSYVLKDLGAGTYYYAVGTMSPDKTLYCASDLVKITVTVEAAQTPDDETPDDETPDDETPGNETPDDETPGNETPDDEAPGNETPDDETPKDENAGSGNQDNNNGAASGETQTGSGNNTATNNNSTTNTSSNSNTTHTAGNVSTAADAGTKTASTVKTTVTNKTADKTASDNTADDVETEADVEADIEADVEPEAGNAAGESEVTVSQSDENTGNEEKATDEEPVEAKTGTFPVAGVVAAVVLGGTATVGGGVVVLYNLGMIKEVGFLKRFGKFFKFFKKK